MNPTTVANSGTHELKAVHGLGQPLTLFGFSAGLMVGNCPLPLNIDGFRAGSELLKS